LLGPGSINSIQLSNLREEHRTGGQLRIRAKGIGEVFWIYSSGAVRQVVYYRVNGATGGSLIYTAFAPGAVLDGIFF